MQIGDFGIVDPTYDPSDHNLQGQSLSTWATTWGDVIRGGQPVIITEDFVNNWLVAYNSSLPRLDQLLVPKNLVTLYDMTGGGTGGGMNTLEQLESQIPGIGGALVKLTEGWESLNWIEKGLILAAVALIGIEALGALGVSIGVPSLLTILRSIPVLGGIFGGNPGGSGGGGGVVASGFVPAWKANGIQFYRRADGWLGVLNHKGRWKQWKPKRPIVLYASGASNLHTFIRAGRAISRQGKALKSTVEAAASGPAPRRQPREPRLTASQWKALQSGA